MKLENKTLEELTKMSSDICEDPKNKNTDPNSIFIYTKQAVKKLDLIGREIQWHLRQRKIARGETINDCGYSGRKCNKRR